MLNTSLHHVSDGWDDPATQLAHHRTGIYVSCRIIVDDVILDVSNGKECYVICA